jgi:Mn2+/Fe2+ NRAMP family transporter
MPIPEPPRGLRRIQALGPGFLWMVSAAGSGELLFTPRVGALYGYALLWAMVAAVSLKWVINREIGRFAVGTGTPILEGFATLPGPRNWAVWVILVPQAVVAVSALAGMAGAAATALTLVLPGPVQLWMTASLLASTALVLFGRYRAIEIVATVIGVALGGAALVAASGTAPSLASVAKGLVPALPANVNYAEILPWLGFMLSGAAGMMWYSYWVVEKGYGGAAHERGASEGPEAERRLQGWLRQMTFDNTVAVVGTFVVTGAFLVLGAEILGPKRLVPEEDRVAAVLGELLGERFGRIGFWFMVAAVFVGFWDTFALRPGRSRAPVHQRHTPALRTQGDAASCARAEDVTTDLRRGAHGGVAARGVPSGGRACRAAQDRRRYRSDPHSDRHRPHAVPESHATAAGAASLRRHVCGRSARRRVLPGIRRALPAGARVTRTRTPHKAKREQTRDRLVAPVLGSSRPRASATIAV